MNSFRHTIAVRLLAAVVVLPLAHVALGQDPADAKSRIQDEELTRRLKEAALGKQAESTLARVIRLMTVSRDQLGDRFDPGESTQEVQKEIIQALDQAMKHARAGLSRQPSSAPAGESDPREKGKRDQNQQEKAGDRQPKPKPSGDSENAGAAKGAVRSGRIGSDIRETAREWGNLPPRDRDEVVQGFTEEILMKYRRMIEKYYRALAEQADQ